MKRDLAALAAREWDVAVVGGGIYGAAVAWDAAQRGLSVALVEREDFGAGASWNSLKTIHGGMRYLQKLDLGRLRESARERTTLLAIAPELVRPLPFVVPTYGHGSTGREALALEGDDLELPPRRLLACLELLPNGGLDPLAERHACLERSLSCTLEHAITEGDCRSHAS